MYTSGEFKMRNRLHDREPKDQMQKAKYRWHCLTTHGRVYPFPIVVHGKEENNSIFSEVKFSKKLKT